MKEKKNYVAEHVWFSKKRLVVSFFFFFWSTRLRFSWGRGLDGGVFRRVGRFPEFGGPSLFSLIVPVTKATIQGQNGTWRLHVEVRGVCQMFYLAAAAATAAAERRALRALPWLFVKGRVCVGQKKWKSAPTSTLAPCDAAFLPALTLKRG